ncbi:hypothetical protein BWI15_25365 [Kribbella sp. ALI-6-A]|uniref:hypothetical protein n=1 Tax=Kribbella sp. ALI-6-A TaxID=1933817 RepID=UPI00097C667D|nr:hypothetical protein [Kribbella sp. ALI-6-A]ONI69852.1 hypothetical protein BWI15_25365 [Kribbella sp. ALI-6-A]
MVVAVGSEGVGVLAGADGVGLVGGTTVGGGLVAGPGGRVVAGGGGTAVGFRVGRCEGRIPVPPPAFSSVARNFPAVAAFFW